MEWQSQLSRGVPPLPEGATPIAEAHVVVYGWGEGEAQVTVTLPSTIAGNKAPPSAAEKDQLLRAVNREVATLLKML